MISYLYVPPMPYGKARRQFIKDWFILHPDGLYAVNCKYRPQVHDDPDLKKLISDGFLKRKRVKYSSTSAMTFLEKHE